MSDEALDKTIDEARLLIGEEGLAIVSAESVISSVLSYCDSPSKVKVLVNTNSGTHVYSSITAADGGKSINEVVNDLSRNYSKSVSKDENGTTIIEYNML